MPSPQKATAVCLRVRDTPARRICRGPAPRLPHAACPTPVRPWRGNAPTRVARSPRPSATPLVLQPHGNEGLLRLLIETDTGDLAIANREHEGASRGNLDTVAAPLVRYV